MVMLALYRDATTLIATRAIDSLDEIAGHLATAVVTRVFAAGGHVTITVL